MTRTRRRDSAAADPVGSHANGDGELERLAWQVEEASLVLVEMTLSAFVQTAAISPSQMRVLLAVDRHGPLNLGSLAARLSTTVSAASRLVSRMDEAGLLERGMAPHSRREINVRVTPAGQQVLQRLRKHRRRQIEQLLTRLSPTASRQLARGLRQLAAATDWTP